jgi:hypothetical protein
MKHWFNKVFSSNTDISSKRIFGGITIFVCISLAFVATFTQYQCPIEMFDALIFFAGGNFGLTSIETIFKKFQKDDSKNESSN